MQNCSKKSSSCRHNSAERILHMKKFLKSVVDTILFIFGLDCEIRRNAVDENLIDHSGQGRDKYGR